MPLVNWDGERRHPCPCGKGEYVHRWIDYSMFAGTRSEEWLMLCPECEPKYSYDSTVIGPPRDGDQRGWVLNTTLAAEGDYRQRRDEYWASLIAEADRRFRSEWRARVEACRTKKALWQLTGEQQAYGTFTNHHRGKSVQLLRDEIAATPFPYYWLPAILKACGFEGKPQELLSDREPERPASLARYDLW
jgi:hypothetical protein